MAKDFAAGIARGYHKRKTLDICGAFRLIDIEDEMQPSEVVHSMLKHIQSFKEAS